MVKMICIDLDGTLLDDQNQVSSANQQAINKAIKQGIKVVLVSGRPNCFARRIKDMLNPAIGYITFNGGYYQLGDEEHYFPISYETTLKIAQKARDLQVRTFFKNRNLGLCSGEDPHTLDYDDYRDETPVEDQLDIHYNVDVVEYLANHHFEPLKILTWDDNYRPLEDFIATLDDVALYRHDTYCELSSIETSKGKAIMRLCDELAISYDEVMVIGDGGNDLSMFEVAGTSVAMGNAVAELKQAADYISADNNHSGVAEAINKFI